MKTVSRRQLLLCSFILFACSPSIAATSNASSSRTSTVRSGAQVDNSTINKRDRNQRELTADQQASGTNDTEITRVIRRQITKDHSLSIYAHNVKIITVDGVVTLKGPVRSKAEKMTVEKFAKSAAGVSSVEDELSIKL